MPAKIFNIQILILLLYLCDIQLNTRLVIVIWVEILDVGVIHHLRQNSSNLGAINLSLSLSCTSWPKLHRNVIVLVGRT